MSFLPAILAILLVAAGIAGTVFPLLPGPPLVLAGLWLLAWQDAYIRVGLLTLGVLSVLVLLATLVDHFAAVLGVRRAGASRQAVIGAFLGGLAGIFGGLPGVILGPAFGALLGEWLAGRGHAQAARAGLAAGLSFFFATVFKLALVFAMLGIFALSWFS